MLKLKEKKRLIWFGAACLIFILIPSLFLAQQLNQNFSSILLALLSHFLIFISILLAFFIISQIGDLIFPKIILVSLSAFYYLAISFFIGYWLYTGNTFDLFFFLDSYQEIVKTGINIFGVNLIFIIVVFIGLGVAYYLLFLTLFNYIKNVKIKNFTFYRKCGIIFTILISIIFIPRAYGYVAKQYIIEVTEINKARKIILPFFPDNSVYETASSENIFILQLESGNSLATTGNFTFQDKQYNDTYTPHFYNIAKDGILLPFFFGNSIQTNRAQLNILCGVTNNIGKSFSIRPDEIATDCLPKILKKNGYKTIMFRSDNLEFANTGNFMENIGFEEIHYQDIMKESDIKYSWGYDDCTFYQRAFEYLGQNYPQDSKLFVYFEVSSHHVPFQSKQKYNFTHKFNPPTNFIEQYLNSYLEQDYCASRFYDKFKKYNNKMTHLFILPDNSWPIGLHNNNVWNEKNAFNDNFLIPFIYIPPTAKKEEFKIGQQINERIFSQADIIPTIFELLNNKNYQNSFAFALRDGGDEKEKKYEDCHILTQPYGGGAIAIVKNLDKYIYYISEKKLVYYDLTKDWDETNPHIITENLSYQELKEKYYCERYK